MQNVYFFFLFCFLFACGDTEEDWQPLFQENGKDWTIAGTAFWLFPDGNLFGKSTSNSGYVVTKDSFTDFQLRFEFFPDKQVNSGVFIRCGDEINPNSCYEINIWDHHPDQDFRTGAVVTFATPLARVETVDKWNTCLLVVEGDHLQAWFNEVQTVDLRDSRFQKGTIALQVANMGEIKFRNVQIKAL